MGARTYPSVRANLLLKRRRPLMGQLDVGRHKRALTWVYVLVSCLEDRIMYPLERAEVPAFSFSAGRRASWRRTERRCPRRSQAEA
jgi:hypothetical protein